MKKLNEPEFIVSTEELKKNRERALLREQQEREEKQEKINTIVIVILAIIIIFLLGKSIIAMSDKAVDSCIKAGNNERWCNIHLRG